MVLIGKFSGPYSQYPVQVQASGGAVYPLSYTTFGHVSAGWTDAELIGYRMFNTRDRRLGLNPALVQDPDMRSPSKWENYFGNFLVFLNFRPFLGPFLGTVVKNENYKKKVAPGIDLNLCYHSKILALIFGLLKWVFLNCTFLGPQLNRLVLVHTCFGRILLYF